MGRVKKGQSANQAALVMILITVLIILYILFLPPEDRAALLGEESGSGTGETSSALLSTTPGRIYPSGNNVIEHTIPSFLVFTVTNADELKRMDYLYVKNSAFGDQIGEVPFFYDSRTMDDLKLSFNVKTHSGKLRMKLNDYTIFEGEISDGSPAPISLPKEYLLPKNNLLIEVSEPGAAFWRINEYELENVLVSGKVTDYSAATSEQHFSISDTEYEKIESATLEFLPDCPPREDGILQILINSRVIYTSYPDCGIKANVEVGKEFFKPGDNILVANTNRGSFLMDAPKIVTYLKESEQPVYYFNIPPQMMQYLIVGQQGLVVSLRFATSGVKRGYVEINGYKSYFETQDTIHQGMIDPQTVQAGSNAIKIVPSDTMDLTELKVGVI